MDHPPRHRPFLYALAALLAIASGLPVLAAGDLGLSPLGNYAIPAPNWDDQEFGHTLAVGDFDGDGVDDLAVGSFGDQAHSGYGRVDLYLGDGAGLTFAGSYSGVKNAWAGNTLAAGDFDGDGKDELAVGAPESTINNQVSAGSVYIVTWTGSALSKLATFFQGSSTGETLEAYDSFGSALASGDFNGDGVDDLAIGVPYEDLQAAGHFHGLVHVFYGIKDVGLTGGSQTWTQASAGIYGTVGDSDLFGWALAAGDFDGDGFDDLAIGVRGEPAGAAAHAGGVNILYGTLSGLTAYRNQLWVPGSGGLPGNPLSVEWFGYALSACDFNHDGTTDLAIGAPHADAFGMEDAGMVWELHGSSPGGITGAGSTLWTAYDLVGNVGENPDKEFGRSLACGSFDRGLYADLAIGSPGHDLQGTAEAGVVDVIYGTSNGLHPLSAQRFRSSGLAGAEPDLVLPRFGSALAAGDFDGHGHADLAIGFGCKPADGVQLILGDGDVLFFDRFETGDIQAWSATVP